MNFNKYLVFFTNYKANKVILIHSPSVNKIKNSGLRDALLKFYGEYDWIGMEDGIVGLSELTGNVAPGTKKAVEEAAARFSGRSFDVFYGPVTDNEGRLRVPEGESMSDDEMLNRFDWYVEGVIVEE